MPKKALRPICFVAMPFGKKAPPGKRTPLVDFDRIYSHIQSAATTAGMEVIRADFETVGGFIHKPMYERLLVAEYVVADLTFANANVMYEVGVRHGASDRATVLLCAEPFVSSLPFDFRPLRVLPYGLRLDGRISPAQGAGLAKVLTGHLRLARRRQLPMDNPIVQVTGWKPGGKLEHSKTDAFLERVQFTGELGKRIQAALAAKNIDTAIQQLEQIEKEVVTLPRDVADVHSALVGVFLGYREKKAYARMVSLFDKFPVELKQTPMGREQYALALNRLAEEAAGEGKNDEADELRKRALDSLDAMQAADVSSETFGIRGRIYKGWYDAALKGTRDQDREFAEAMLTQAITTYEDGFRADMRDYYPGVNALTLRVLRGTGEDLTAIAQLAPVVRFAVDAAPAPKTNAERYWQQATRFEIACTDRNWETAAKDLERLLAIPAEDWMRETTVKNLRLLQSAFQGDPNVADKLEGYITTLTRKR
jgi:tetratricopeptide (TPR) repeat protein